MSRPDDTSDLERSDREYATEGATTGIDTPEETDTGDGSESAPTEPDIPDWEDEYLDRVSDRLMYNYDLEKDVRVGGETFDLYGRMVLYSQKHFFHPAMNFANHETHEHLFATRMDSVRESDLDRYVDLGHQLADEWIDADEEHYCSEFTFVLVTSHIPEAVIERVEGFRDRTLIKFGYYGHYEVNLVVVDPDEETIAASQEADVATAFRLWDPIEKEEPGILDLIARRLQV